METVRPDAALPRRREIKEYGYHHTPTRDGYDMLKVHQTSRKKSIDWANGGRGSENIFVIESIWIHPIFRYIEYEYITPVTILAQCDCAQCTDWIESWMIFMTARLELGTSESTVQSSLSFFHATSLDCLVVLVYYPDWVSTLSFGCEDWRSLTVP